MRRKKAVGKSCYWNALVFGRRIEVDTGERREAFIEDRSGYIALVQSTLGNYVFDRYYSRNDRGSEAEEIRELFKANGKPSHGIAECDLEKSEG